MPEIKVHEKALAHLSRGLYRSPASAIRELVSNAWDANATSVRIDTGYPFFTTITVEDNGDGFSRESFTTLMDGGIGNSEKRPQHKALRDGREIIGRLGIGMLGIAQICGSFTVTSKMKDGTGFHAIVTLYDLLKENLDKEEPTVSDPIEVGEYKFDDTFNLSGAKFGTTIKTNDVHPTFARSFQQSVSGKGYKRVPRDWRKAIKIPSQAQSLKELGDYWRFIWELSASCPIPYVAPDAIPKGLVKGEQARLESYNFTVFVDNLELRKPMVLKGNKAGYTTHKIDEQTYVIYNRLLRFHGYIVVQEGSQLRPDELRGILIRIKNVAIGYYDQTMLDYRHNEGPRNRWITGEIYVDEGLEDALNIDRDSFNRFHPQFKQLQEFVHDVLKDDVFPKVYKQIDVRSARRMEEKGKQHVSHLSAVLSDVLDTRVTVRGGQTKAEKAAEFPVLVEQKTGVSVVLPDSENVSIKKSQKSLALAVLAIFEAAMSESTATRRREAFRSALLALLSKW
jgi:Histidine kinase-, DNA gyrase B-, and HSP90-like ATPase